jgi:hypothetical protein
MSCSVALPVICYSAGQTHVSTCHYIKNSPHTDGALRRLVYHDRAARALGGDRKIDYCCIVGNPGAKRRAEAGRGPAAERGRCRCDGLRHGGDRGGGQPSGADPE